MMALFKRSTTRQVRWLIDHDETECAYIDCIAFRPGWTVGDFKRCRRELSVVGIVATSRSGIDGFCLFRLEKDTIRIIRMAVQLDERRLGVGSMLVERLIERLKPQRRRFIEVDVPERMTSAQLFFSANGFTAWQDAGSDVVSMLFERI